MEPIPWTAKEVKHLVVFHAWANGSPLCALCEGVGERETVDEDGGVTGVTPCPRCGGTGKAQANEDVP